MQTNLYFSAQLRFWLLCNLLASLRSAWKPGMWGLFLYCSQYCGRWWPGASHDDVIKHFPRYWPFVGGIHRSPMNSPHMGQWRGALMFSLICVWINCWVNNREAGDLRRYRAHYDVTVIYFICRHRDDQVRLMPDEGRFKNIYGLLNLRVLNSNIWIKATSLMCVCGVCVCILWDHSR